MGRMHALQLPLVPRQAQLQQPLGVCAGGGARGTLVPMCVYGYGSMCTHAVPGCTDSQVVAHPILTRKHGGAAT